MADAKGAGEKFLAENAKKSGVVVTTSGLQYKILTEGKGDKKPTKSNTVTTHYKGALIDGTEFDSSYERDEPTTFGVGQVIAGWTEALQLMSVGSKLELYIPSNLAYGRNGIPGVIPGDSVLVFTVELLKIS
jgi:FKBP-type peptidyl-prolyl cis-trans isomerase